MRILQRLIASVVVVTGLMTSATVWAADKTVLITGSNRGIGFEFVKQYTEKGWTVIATARNPDGADDLKTWALEHDNVIVEKLDLLDHAGIDALAAKYDGQSIDVLLNNAGLMRGPDKEQMIGMIDYDEFIRFYRINAMGPLKVAEAFAPHVMASEAKIMAALTTSKRENGIPGPGFSLYKTSKAALDSIWYELHLRWRGNDVKSIVLMPGRVLTHGEPPQPGTVPIQDSIAGMISILDTATMEQSGHTYNWDGAVIE